MNQQQLNFPAARAAADTGMQAAADHADRVQADWTTDAAIALRLCARGMSGEFTFEAVRLEAEKHIQQPPDKRAWGVVCRQAIRDGVIVPTGRYAPRASGNCTPTMTYVRGEQ